MESRLVANRLRSEGITPDIRSRTRVLTDLLRELVVENLDGCRARGREFPPDGARSGSSNVGPNVSDNRRRTERSNDKLDRTLLVADFTAGDTTCASHATASSATNRISRS